ncbi:MAG: MarR family transcriptional regulator [Syntrophomonadaceae bacterium]|jgi:DtxR family Mn-dependent transcriptional regulator|nr:MarR family transcriptional regulator [Syntrophomonadaceae bacterium]
MGKDKEFRTIRGYELLRQKHNLITPSMEDYLEMAYRIYQQTGCIRIGDLASRLNVRPPSASRMVQKLARKGYLIGEKYGVIELTKQGTEYGSYLVTRHAIIEHFLKLIGVTRGILEQTEKIEHYLQPETVEKLSMFNDFAENNPQWQKAFHAYRQGLERN